MRVVFTGGPGAGKTTVLNRLSELGYVVLPEVARSIIAARKAEGLSPRPAPAEFARAILEKDIAQYSASGSDLAFYDRGIPDALGMLKQCGDLPAEQLVAMLAQYPYASPVFVFPPWKEIYRTDSERDQSFEEAVAVHSSIMNWYAECGYELSVVPPGTVAERCDYVLKTVGVGTGSIL